MAVIRRKPWSSHHTRNLAHNIMIKYIMIKHITIKHIMIKRHFDENIFILSKYYYSISKYLKITNINDRFLYKLSVFIHICGTDLIVTSFHRYIIIVGSKSLVWREPYMFLCQSRLVLLRLTLALTIIWNGEKILHEILPNSTQSEYLVLTNL